ncbi:hypothetical protein DB88DRAFT_472772 [Papiliotrema laurentii]|uniref:Uncharacterized protein n=1 Tax=Papiliotrema laurentii TaxID=5418 RepID=A0AAD9CZ01_PAPLA|nr:hypothetical protein DB88DRAFT_472772 [Papiliotrema laurentii]
MVIVGSSSEVARRYGPFFLSSLAWGEGEGPSLSGGVPAPETSPTIRSLCQLSWETGGARQILRCNVGAQGLRVNIPIGFGTDGEDDIRLSAPPFLAGRGWTGVVPSPEEGDRSLGLFRSHRKSRKGRNDNYERFERGNRPASSPLPWVVSCGAQAMDDYFQKRINPDVTDLYGILTDGSRPDFGNDGWRNSSAPSIASP